MRGTSIGSPGMRKRIEVIAPPYVPEAYIAVSRMSAGVTPILYVNGNARTTPITSVRPGSTATSMPITRPIARTARFTGVKSTPNPVASWVSASMSGDSQHAQQADGERAERPFAERQRDVGDAHED